MTLLLIEYQYAWEKFRGTTINARVTVLAHLSRSDKVSFCDQLSSVVLRRPSSSVNN